MFVQVHSAQVVLLPEAAHDHQRLGGVLLLGDAAELRLEAEAGLRQEEGLCRPPPPAEGKGARRARPQGQPRPGTPGNPLLGPEAGRDRLAKFFCFIYTNKVGP